MTVPIGPGVRIGHVNLKVSDLDRSLALYRDVLGFERRCGWATARRSCRLGDTVTTTG